MLLKLVLFNIIESFQFLLAILIYTLYIPEKDQNAYKQPNPHGYILISLHPSITIDTTM